MVSPYGAPASGCERGSVRFWQAQDTLRDKAENELRRDRGKLRDHAFSEIAFDVIFLGVTEAAEGGDRSLAGFMAGLSGEVLCCIGRRAAGDAAVILPCRLERHQFGGFEFHPALRQRMLDR